MALRTLLRRWLGITSTEARLVLLQNTIDGVHQMAADLTRKHTELNAALQQVRELKEMIQSPGAIPVRTRTTRAFRALMEQDS